MASTDHSPAPAETSNGSPDSAYPPQRHAGAVGYGPNYGKGAGTADQLRGLGEEVIGKMVGKPGLAQHGRDLRTGELKRKELEADFAKDPFNTASQGAQSEGQPGADKDTAPEDTEKVEE